MKEMEMSLRNWCGFHNKEALKEPLVQSTKPEVQKMDGDQNSESEAKAKSTAKPSQSGSVEKQRIPASEPFGVLYGMKL
jgi:hypothetical protein